MDEKSQSQQSDLPSIPSLLRAISIRPIELALTPFFLAVETATRYIKRIASPILHLAFLISLIPFLGISSLGAGLIINSWIPTGWTQQIFLQYGDLGLPPHAEIVLPGLSLSQPYDISVELILPVFAKNAELGNFMTSLTIKTPTNVTLASASRPSIIFPPRVYLSPLVFSGLRSRTTHVVELLKEFSATSYASSLRAFVTVGRNDAWRGIGVGQGRELVVADAFIKGVPRLRGIKAFFARHTFILLCITTTTFFISSLAITLAVYLSLSPRIHIIPPTLEEETKLRETTESEEPFGIKEEEDSDAASDLLTTSLGPNASVTGTRSRTTRGDDEEDEKEESDMSVVE